MNTRQFACFSLTYTLALHRWYVGEAKQQQPFVLEDLSAWEALLIKASVINHENRFLGSAYAQKVDDQTQRSCVRLALGGSPLIVDMILGQNACHMNTKSQV